MKYLPIVCLLLWIVPFIGKQTVPSIFSAWYVQWPLFLLLSILVPYGFAKSIRTSVENKLHYKECGHCFFFLFIFLANNFLMVVGVNTLQSIPKFLTASSTHMPENLSLQAINNENSDNRKLIASVIYTQFGQPIVYKDDSNKLVVYAPTEEEKLKYKANEITVSKAKDLVKSIKNQTLEVTYLYLWSMLSFFFTFALTFFIEQRKASNVVAPDY